MGTVVFFHAHPDDEALTTGGSMARAAAEGHRVVHVIATNGELGEAPDALAAGETLVDRRRAETERSAAILGVHRLEWLGYHDSGMTGWEQNERSDSFWRADVDTAATRLVHVLRAERADVLVAYDWHGGYGHPDHIQVHRVGLRAAELAGAVRVLEVTYNRDAILAGMAEPDGDGGPDFDPSGPADDGNPFGTPEAELHLAVDVAPYVTLKHRSIACHASQVTDTAYFVDMPPAKFALWFSTEWYIEPDAPPGLRPGWLFE